MCTWAAVPGRPSASSLLKKDEKSGSFSVMLLSHSCSTPCTYHANDSVGTMCAGVSACPHRAEGPLRQRHDADDLGMWMHSTVANLHLFERSAEARQLTPRSPIGAFACIRT